MITVGPSSLNGDITAFMVVPVEPWPNGSKQDQLDESAHFRYMQTTRSQFEDLAECINMNSIALGHETGWLHRGKRD